MTCFVGVGLGRWLGAGFAHMGDGIIDLLVDGHNPTDRAHGEVRTREQAPETELPGVGMTFLQVIHLDHDGKPPLPRGLGAPFVVHEPGKVLGLKARDPPIHGWP
jgi:hypothetical protein